MVSSVTEESIQQRGECVWFFF